MVDDHNSIQDSTGFWVTRLARSMEQDFEKRLQAIGITRSAYAVLSAIHHDKKATPAEIDTIEYRLYCGTIPGRR